MQLIYNVIDGIIAMALPKRVFAILGTLILLIAILASVYFLFRTYNLAGLIVFSIIMQILVPRDSVLERIEMKKLQNQDRIKAEQVTQNV